MRADAHSRTTMAKHPPFGWRGKEESERRSQRSRKNRTALASLQLFAYASRGIEKKGEKFVSQSRDALRTPDLAATVRLMLVIFRFAHDRPMQHENAAYLMSR